MSSLQLGTSIYYPPSFSSSHKISSTNLRFPVNFYPSLSCCSNHSENLSFSAKYNARNIRSLRKQRFFRFSCSAEAAKGSELVVKEKSVSVILLAGGKGKRMGASMPKQYIPLLGQPIALYSFYTFSKMSQVKEIVVVCDPSYQDVFEDSKENIQVDLKFALPGKERQDSVYSGFKAIDPNSELVCIHDSARPLVLEEDVEKVLKDGRRIGAAVLGVPAKATIKEANSESFVVKTLDRKTLWEMQTPQVIEPGLLKKGFELVNRILESEVRDALKMMKGGKAMGPDGIPIEVWKCLGDVAIVWLTKLFNRIFRSNKMPDEWRRSTLVPIYKNKGDVQNCTNFGGSS